MNDIPDVNVPDMPLEKKPNLWKYLLLTFLGTTLSIILTFGTSALVQQHRRMHDRKMTVLMVMGSVEKFAQKLDERAENLERSDTMATYLLNIPVDSLESSDYQRNIKLIGIPLGIAYDKTAESVFINNTASWSSTKYFDFINWAGVCFYNMKSIEDKHNSYIAEFEAAFDEIWDHPELHPGNSMKTKFLLNKKYRELLKGIHDKAAYYRYLADKMRDHNRVSMEMMDVSEKELMKFVEDNEAVAKMKNVSRTIKQYLNPELNIDSLPAMEEWLKK
ncbi:MAG: hypothetical protein J6V98_05620 [Bacteroidales bacterium]|nr:hypothetical protein [Bacteroidales bacterium]